MSSLKSRDYGINPGDVAMRTFSRIVLIKPITPLPVGPHGFTTSIVLVNINYMPRNY